tara:strand:+ start:250 stop:774 length:525 start_codon:yes stop_codon:yes gene_type:complete
MAAMGPLALAAGALMYMNSTKKSTRQVLQDDMPNYHQQIKDATAGDPTMLLSSAYGQDMPGLIDRMKAGEFKEFGVVLSPQDIATADALKPQLIEARLQGKQIESIESQSAAPEHGGGGGPSTAEDIAAYVAQIDNRSKVTGGRIAPTHTSYDEFNMPTARFSVPFAPGGTGGI